MMDYCRWKGSRGGGKPPAVKSISCSQVDSLSQPGLAEKEKDEGKAAPSSVTAYNRMNLAQIMEIHADNQKKPSKSNLDETKISPSSKTIGGTGAYGISTLAMRHTMALRIGSFLSSSAKPMLTVSFNASPVPLNAATFNTAVGNAMATMTAQNQISSTRCTKAVGHTLLRTVTVKMGPYFTKGIPRD